MPKKSVKKKKAYQLMCKLMQRQGLMNDAGGKFNKDGKDNSMKRDYFGGVPARS